MSIRQNESRPRERGKTIRKKISHFSICTSMFSINTYKILNLQYFMAVYMAIMAMNYMICTFRYKTCIFVCWFRHLFYRVQRSIWSSDFAQTLFCCDPNNAESAFVNFSRNIILRCWFTCGSRAAECAEWSFAGSLKPPITTIVLSLSALPY